jgi:hypothetical protein
MADPTDAQQPQDKGWNMSIEYPLSKIVEIIFNMRFGVFQLLSKLRDQYNKKALSEKTLSLAHRDFEIANAIQEVINRLPPP